MLDVFKIKYCQNAVKSQLSYITHECQENNSNEALSEEFNNDSFDNNRS